MKQKPETLNQIVAELELFACYKCTHNGVGSLIERTNEEQERLCRSCFMHDLDRRMKAVEFYPLEGFDKSLARRNRASYWDG